jgi:hypothetical protein
VSQSNQGTLLASSDARGWSTRGSAGGDFFILTSLADGTLLADINSGGSHHIARSTNHGQSWTDVLDLDSGYRTLTPHNFAELDGSVYLIEYQDYTEGATTIRLWQSTDDGATWRVRHSFSTHRHGHGLLADQTRHALWVFFGDTDAQCGIYRSTDGGDTWTLMLANQPGDIVDAMLLDDGSLLFGQDISYLPTMPHIARLTPGGGYSELAEIPGPSYGAHRMASGGFIVGSEREPGGDIYPPGEVSAHVFGSLDGVHWEELLEYPRLSDQENVRADVFWELPNGEMVLELENARGFGSGGRGYQLLRVGR